MNKKTGVSRPKEIMLVGVKESWRIGEDRGWGLAFIPKNKVAKNNDAVEPKKKISFSGVYALGDCGLDGCMAEQVHSSCRVKQYDTRRE